MRAVLNLVRYISRAVIKCVKKLALELVGIYLPRKGSAVTCPRTPIVMAFLVNSLDTTILLQFLAELFLSNFLIRSGDVELNPGPKGYRHGGIGESVLFYVAKLITQRGKIESVGKGLGFPSNEIDMYVALSDIEGAYQMLKYWKEKSPAKEQLEYLTTSLTAAACQDIVKILAPDSGNKADEKAVSESEGAVTWRSMVLAMVPTLVTSGLALLVGLPVATDTGYAAGAVGTGAGVAMGYSSRSRLQISLTDDMISILVRIPWPTEGLSVLGRAMQLTPGEIESYRKKNEILTDLSGSKEMIKKWRHSLMDQNQVAAICELMVKANMKPQADEFYEICDRIINTTTLETLRKVMIKDAPPAYPRIENVTNHENTVIKTFDERGGQLYLKIYDVTLQIPPGVIECGTSRQIALKVLTTMPLPLKLGGNEMIASLGFQCFPSGVTFTKPVTLTMPHCADLLDPANCELTLYLIQDGLENPSITRSQLSPETCRVRESHFDLSLKHFSWGFITWLRMRGINMLCMPYLPRQVPLDTCRKVNVEVCLYKHIKGCETSVGRGGDDDVRACLRKAEEFTLRSRGKSPLIVSYQFGGENEIPDSQTLTYEDIARTVASKSVFLDLDLAGKGDSNRITLWLKPHRSHPIKFTTKFGTLPKIDRLMINMTVSEAQLMRLSTRLPHNKYTDFCHQLGIQYNEAMGILARFSNSYSEAYKQALVEWRDRTGGSMDNLIVALEKAGLGGFSSAFSS